jgi:hypothetical protein
MVYQRMKRTNLVLLIAIFALLAMFSLVGVYFAQQTPTEQSQVSTLLTYNHDGQYDYVAHLAFNNLYNKTTLKPGEGTLYTGITDLIDFTFTYTFNCSLPANITVQYLDDEFVQSSNWNKTISVSPASTLNFSNTSIAQFSFARSINVTALGELRDAIDQETNTYTLEFSFVIQPEIQVTANTAMATVNEPFTPDMNMTFYYGSPQGNYIDIEGLTNSQQGNVQKTETTSLPDTMTQRYISYALSVIFISALLYTTWTYVKAKPERHETTEKSIEEIIAPYEEVIFNLTEEPTQASTATTTVKMKSLDDLASIADGLAKPILHLKKAPGAFARYSPSEGETHVFYVLDGSVRYEYEIREPRTETAGRQS